MALSTNCNLRGAQVPAGSFDLEPLTPLSTARTNQTPSCAVSPPRWPGSAPLCPPAASHRLCHRRAPLFSRRRTQPGFWALSLKRWSIPVPKPRPTHTQTLNPDLGPFLGPEARPSIPRPRAATRCDCPLPLQTGGGEFKATASPLGRF